MRTFLFATLTALLISTCGFTQSGSLTGTWQIAEEKTCFLEQVQSEESDTEKELLQGFGQTRTSVARIIRFKSNGTGEESIFNTGRRRGEKLREFKYSLTGDQLLLLDKKSGLMTQKLIVEELSAGTLRFHIDGKECEIKSFTKIR